MTKNDQLGVALVGAGLIGLQAHLPAWREQPGIDMVAVIDSDLSKAEHAARASGITHYSDQLDDILARDDVDIVDICTPPSSHLPLTMRALDAGKHVLVEKPIAGTLEDAQALVDAGSRHAGVLMVAENWPFATATRRVRELVSSGFLGRPFAYRATHESDQHLPSGGQPTWIRENESAGGGILIQAGIHCVTSARHLMGEVTSVMAFRTSLLSPATEVRSNESDIVLALQFEGDGVGTMNVTGRSRRPGARQLGQAVFGDQGTIEYDVLSGAVAYNREAISFVERPSAPSMGFNEEIETFLACIRGGEAPPFPIEDQLASLAVVLAAYESLELRVAVNPSDLLARVRSRSESVAGPDHSEQQRIEESGHARS